MPRCPLALSLLALALGTRRGLGSMKLPRASAETGSKESKTPLSPLSPASPKKKFAAGGGERWEAAGRGGERGGGSPGCVGCARSGAVL